MVCRIWTQNLENVVQCTTAWATIAGSCRTLSCIGSLSVHGLGDPMRLDRTVWKSLRASCQVSQFTIIEAGEVQRGQWMEFFEDLSGWRGSQQLQHLTPNGYWAPPPLRAPLWWGKKKPAPFLALDWSHWQTISGDLWAVRWAATWRMRSRWRRRSSTGWTGAARRRRTSTATTSAGVTPRDVLRRR